MSLRSALLGVWLLGLTPVAAAVEPTLSLVIVDPNRMEVGLRQLVEAPQ